MFAKIKADWIYALLLPTPFLASDFIDTWFIYYLFFNLVALIFIKLPKFFTYLQLMALYYHFSLGHTQMVPETTVPVLAITLIMRFIQMRSIGQKETYPIFLWLGAFALFSSTFSYLSYVFAVTIVLFSNFKGHKLKNLKVLSITALITFILFLFFPRFHQFLPSVRSIPQGEIGYSQSISNSDTTNLNLSSKTAFYAELSRDVPAEQLYWRGRVHSETDGYNWNHTPPNPTRGKIVLGKSTIQQKIKFEQDMDGDIILLDTPVSVIDTNLNVHRLASTLEFRSSVKKKKSEITALSSLQPASIILNDKDLIPYLKLPKNLSKGLYTFSNRISDGDSVSIIKNFSKVLEEDKFSYSLSPGRLPRMDDFLEKKVGYCSHFASLLGLVLRIKKIPSRLVSGFQGGKFNEMGNFYEIKSNDAHAWVEYYDQQKWYRVDPTEFISPDRVRLGGEEFLNPSIVNSNQNKTNIFLSSFYKVSQFVNAINYKIGQLIDNYDRNSQNNIAEKLNIKLKYFFYIGGIIIFIIIILYYISIRPKRIKRSYHEAEIYLEKLNKKLRKDKIILLHDYPISLLKDKVLKHPKKELIFEYLDYYQQFRYAKKNKSEILDNILRRI